MGRRLENNQTKKKRKSEIKIEILKILEKSKKPLPLVDIAERREKSYAGGRGITTNGTYQLLYQLIGAGLVGQSKDKYKTILFARTKKKSSLE